jgi:hypothetical protein
MILCAHVRQGRDIFVTNDRKGFIDHGRRESLQAAFETRIMTEAEFIDAYAASRPSPSPE